MLVTDEKYRMDKTLGRVLPGATIQIEIKVPEGANKTHKKPRFRMELMEISKDLSETEIHQNVYFFFFFLYRTLFSLHTKLHQFVKLTGSHVSVNERKRQSLLNNRIIPSTAPKKLIAHQKNRKVKPITTSTRNIILN